MAEQVSKTSRQMERHLKGVANHWRIDILFIIEENPNISLHKIAKLSGGNIKTIGVHVIRLAQSGLIRKKYAGRKVEHSVSPYGKIFLRFLRSFSRIN